ncbi:MAG: S41 family peptidase [Planctomycetota bacterium]
MSRRSYVASLLGISVIMLAMSLMRDSDAWSQEGEVFNEGVIRDVREQILRDYVEEPEDFDMKLYLGALRGMTGSLDPHSSFLSPEQLEELTIDTRGKFGGLGILIEKPMGKLGPIIVITPFLGTPASKAGILPGDRIIAIEGKSTIGMGLMEAVHKLRGDPGEPVKIRVQHAPRNIAGAISAGRVLQGCRLVSIDGEAMAGRNPSEIRKILDVKRGKSVQVMVVPEFLGEPEDKEVIRGVIHVPTVQFHRMIDTEAGIGYAHLMNFQENAADRLHKEVESLRAKGMRALVLDLRGNGGGLLLTAIEVAKLFLPEGRTIVSTKGREQGRQHDYRTSRDGPYAQKSMPMAVLVDGSSASASEILAAAIKDNKRGIVVGSRTFGKGSVQKLFPVTLGRDPKNRGKILVGSLKLTVEKHYTPKDICIQREPHMMDPKKHVWGVEPDIVVEMTDSEYLDWRRQREKDRVTEQDPENGETGKDGKPKTARAVDRPLDRAMEILRAVLVLSGQEQEAEAVAR